MNEIKKKNLMLMTFLPIVIFILVYNTIYVDVSDLTMAPGLSWFSDWYPGLPVEDPIISWQSFVSRFMYKLPFCEQYLYFIYFHLFSLSYISMCLEANMLEIMIIEVSIEDHLLTKSDLGCHFL